jgi:hypothetical protein
MLARVTDTPGSPIKADRLGLALMFGGLGLGALSRSLLPAGDCVAVTQGAAVSFAGAFAAFGYGFARCLTGRAGRYLAIAVAMVAPVVLAFSLAAASRAADCG